MLSDDVIACARLVERGDPARFRATMAAPVAARALLFPLYAFNIEVARIPWMTSEPMIAAMRLQWWRDALEEIASGGMVRRHEVVVPLAGVIGAQDVALLDDLIVARHWDVEREGFADWAALERYIRDTAGALMVVASRVLGGGADEQAAEVGYAHGVAQYLRAVPALLAAGRRPLPDQTPAALQALAEEALKSLEAGRHRVSTALRPAFFPAWETRAVLNKIRHTPEKVLEGGLDLSPVRSQLRLIRQVWTGRI